MGIPQISRFTYVIGYRHKPDRLINLRRTIDWLSGFVGIDLLIIEQDRHSKISHLNLKCRHIFVESDKPYNRAWAFNIAMKHSTTPIIIFGDSDLIMEPNNLIESIKETETYDVVSPYKSVIDLSPQESMMDISSIFSINRPGRGENDHQKINLTGGIVIFKRESLQKVGGWSPEFFGWGGEDDAMTIKCSHFLKSKEMNFVCYHLYHQRAEIQPNLYQGTLQFLQQMRNMNKEDILRYMVMEQPKIGLLNKCVL